MDASHFTCLQRLAAREVFHHVVVQLIEDAGQPCDSDPRERDNASVAQIVDIGSHPTPVVQLPQVVGSFVVAADCMQSVPLRGLQCTAVIVLGAG